MSLSLDHTDIDHLKIHEQKIQMLQFYLLSQSWALWEIRANNLGNKYLNPDNNDNLPKAPKRVTDIGDIAAKESNNQSALAPL